MEARAPDEEVLPAFTKRWLVFFTAEEFFVFCPPLLFSRWINSSCFIRGDDVRKEVNRSVFQVVPGALKIPTLYIPLVQNSILEEYVERIAPNRGF